MIAALVFAQLCGAIPPEGVVVTEGRGGYGAVIAAYNGSVVVGWQETGPRPTADEGGPPEWRPHVAYAREVDPSTLSSRAAARDIARESVFFEHMTGLAASASPTGDGAAIAECQCSGGMGSIRCSSHGFGAFPSLHAASDRGGCSGGVALGTAGDDSVLAFTNAAALRFVGSRTGREHTTSDDLTADRMAIARADADRAVLVWRSGDGTPGHAEVSAMILDADARPSSQPVVFTAAPGFVGVPAVAWVDGAAVVAYARSAAVRSPWQLALATWTPGHRHAVAALRTGRAPAVAPSIVATQTPGCAVLSWTEGTGHRTLVRAGRVCRGVLDPATVAQVSRAGMEAGESELATDGHHVYVVWQEIAAARGRREELRVARLGCE